MTQTPKFQIAVLDRGFVYVGLCTQHDRGLTITHATCIRRWGTTGGLGELATKGPTGKTVLDPAGTVHVPQTALIHLIDVADTAQAAFAKSLPALTTAA